jgi:general secretion pathway protein E
MGSLPSEDLPAIYSRWFGVPVLAEADFRDWQLPAGSEELPLGFLLDHGWLPWEQGADGWIFATSSPCDLEVNAWLAESGSGTELLLLSLDDFEALKARLGIQNRESQLDGLSLVEEDRLRELASEAPTVNLLNQFADRESLASWRLRHAYRASRRARTRSVSDRRCAARYRHYFQGNGSAGHYATQDPGRYGYRRAPAA